MDDAMTSEALLHGKAAATARVRTHVGPLVVVERADVTLEVECCGEGSITALSGTTQNQPCLAVHLLMRLETPLVRKGLGTFITVKESPVLLSAVR